MTKKAILARKLKKLGFVSSQESMRRLKKSCPEVWNELKNPSAQATLAWNLIELRAKNKISQKELSEKSGISLRSINYIESFQEHGTPIFSAEKLAKALGVKFLDLFKPVDLTKV